MTPETTRKTALVTGATGYVGSRLVRQLVAGGWDVHVVVRPDSNLALLAPVRSSAAVHRHNGTTERMLSIVAEAKPSVVFHLASRFLAQHRPEDIEPLVRSNILMGTQLAEAMAKNNIHRLVNTGTSWQHYENSPYDPVCLYAATKQAFEAVLRFYTETTPLKVITLKLFDTYGPDDPRPKLFTVLRKAARERELLAMSPGDQLIDLVYIDDVTRAFSLAAERLLAGSADRSEKYAVSSRSPVSLKQLVETYCHVTGKDLNVQWGGRPYRPREVMVPWHTGSTLPGWEPEVGLEDGIGRMEAPSS
jgi:nucleoside-diphosphate-sugar epimerase